MPRPRKKKPVKPVIKPCLGFRFTEEEEALAQWHIEKRKQVYGEVRLRPTTREFCALKVCVYQIKSLILWQSITFFNILYGNLITDRRQG